MVLIKSFDHDGCIIFLFRIIDRKTFTAEALHVEDNYNSSLDIYFVRIYNGSKETPKNEN